MTDNLDWIFDDDNPIETSETITTRMKRAELKRRTVQALKQETAKEFLSDLPHEGESLHIVSNGSFDYFTFVPLIVDLLPQSYSAHFYGSTWTMNRNNVLEIFELFDTGKLGTLNILTGLYFKRRESSVYATLFNGLETRKQRYRALENHAKIMLFNHQDIYIVVEGSANFTANPRIEQTTIIHDKALWDFHREWMEDILNA